MSPSPAVRWSRIAAFVAWTFVPSWGAAALLHALGVELRGAAGVAVALGYMFLPSVAAVAVVRRAGEPLVSALALHLKPNAWWLAALAVPALATLGATFVAPLLPGVTWSPWGDALVERIVQARPDAVPLLTARLERVPAPVLFVLALGAGALAGATVNLLPALGEELGWRGLLQRELAPLGFWRASAVTGLVWGVWHAPLILQGHNYPQHPVAGVGMMTAMCVLLSPLFAWVAERSRSTLAAGVAHGALNGTAGAATLLVGGGSDLTIGVTGAAGLVALALLNAALVLVRRRTPVTPAR